ncbi:MAG: signal peptidase I [Eubacterium sp.]|nr:signal peptidase I [Eubacterium sp.]
MADYMESSPENTVPGTQDKSYVPQKAKGASDKISERDKEPSPVSRKPGRRSSGQLFVALLLKLIVIAVSVWAMLTFVLGLTIHYGNNMFPAIKDGDLVISLRVHRPYLNAAVLYKQDGKLCTGRVIGMPGMEINITKEGALTVNGIAPAEEVFYPTRPAEDSGISYPCTVGEGQVFILNDFRSDTNDSRTFGGIDIKDVKGPVLLIIRRRGF